MRGLIARASLSIKRVYKMGGKSKSSSRSTSSVTNINRQINGSYDDIENSNIVSNSGDNVNVTVTDHGAINAARLMVGDSLNTAEYIAKNALGSAENIAGDALDTAEGIAYESIELSADTARYSISEMQALSETALDNSESLADSFIVNAKELFNKTTETVKSIAANSQTNGQNVIAESLVSVFKPMMYVGGIIAVVVVVMIFKKGKA